MAQYSFLFYDDALRAHADIVYKGDIEKSKNPPGTTMYCYVCSKEKFVTEFYFAQNNGIPSLFKPVCDEICFNIYILKQMNK